LLEKRGCVYSKFATQLGSGLTEEAIGNYSGVSESFILSADSGPMTVARVITTIRDGTGFLAADYGSINGGLTNGVRLLVEDDQGATHADLTDPLRNIKSNTDWSAYCYDGTIHDFGSGDDFFQTRWTFEKAGRPLMLAPGWKVRVILSDDLSGLSGHVFLFQGLQE
jgi:hypothetical protein